MKPDRDTRKKPENGLYTVRLNEYEDLKPLLEKYTEKSQKMDQRRKPASKSQQGTTWYLSKNPDIINNRAT